VWAGRPPGIFQPSLKPEGVCIHVAGPVNAEY